MGPMERGTRLALAYGGGHCVMAPPQTLNIKKRINSMRIFRGKWLFLGVILQNFPGGMPPNPPRMFGLKFVCDVTRL